GFDDNTLVIFTSDHGDNLNSYNYRIPKDHPEDTAARIPFLMRWPGHLSRAQTRDLLMGPMDMMPTILGLMDLPVPSTVQGKDLSQAVLKGQDDVIESLPLFSSPCRCFSFFPPGGAYTRATSPMPGARCATGITWKTANPDYATNRSRSCTTGATIPINSTTCMGTRLYGDTSATRLQQKMEQLTQQWMDRFNDPGWGSDVIDPMYQYENGQWPQDTQKLGFQGRPVDVIKSVPT
ncbi:MAG: sulfatase-like hydrolase/transferase, partial [Planctomycetota bacterium]